MFPREPLKLKFSYCVPQTLPGAQVLKLCSDRQQLKLKVSYYVPQKAAETRSHIVSYREQLKLMTSYCVSQAAVETGGLILLYRQQLKLKVWFCVSTGSSWSWRCLILCSTDSSWSSLCRTVFHRRQMKLKVWYCVPESVAEAQRLILCSTDSGLSSRSDTVFPQVTATADLLAFQNDIQHPILLPLYAFLLMSNFPINVLAEESQRIGNRRPVSPTLWWLDYRLLHTEIHQKHCVHRNSAVSCWIAFQDYKCHFCWTSWYLLSPVKSSGFIFLGL